MGRDWGLPDMVSPTLQAGPVSPEGTQDGFWGRRLWEEISHCFSTHSRSSIIEDCVVSVLPEKGHSRSEVSQPQKQPCLSLLGYPSKNIGGQVPTCGSNFWSHVLGVEIRL